MSTYLLTFKNRIPITPFVGGGANTYKTESWTTTIQAKNFEEAKQTAIKFGSGMRQRLAKGCDITLKSIEVIKLEDD